MPLLRYFVFVGGALLALLFISNAYLPKLPDEVRADSEVDRSTIRIHSAYKWPERVVFDTNQPTIVPPPAAITIASVQAPAKVADVSAQARVREAFAELPAPIKPRRNCRMRKSLKKPRSENARSRSGVRARPSCWWRNSRSSVCSATARGELTGIAGNFQQPRQMLLICLSSSLSRSSDAAFA